MRGTETFDRAYTAGDTVTLTNTTNCAGVITGGQKSVNFTIPLPNPIHASMVTFTKLNVLIRGITGYIEGSQVDLIASAEYSVTASITANGIYVSCARTNAVTAANNTPIVVDVRSGTSFTFA